MSAPVVGAAVDVVVPASSANLGPGFDSIGLALGIWDAYRVEVTREPGLRFDLGRHAQGVPADDRHLVVETMRRTWRELAVPAPAGLALTCRNTIRMGRGMGSSAAAIVAGVAAALALLDPAAGPGDPGDPRRGQARAARGAPAAGAESPRAIDLDLAFVNDLSSALEGHPDNASASVYGGLTVSWVDSPDGVVDPTTRYRVHSERVELHPDLVPVVLVPDDQLPTSTARAVLPERIPHAEAALNSARAALLVQAVSRRLDLLLPGTREWLHQEQRRPSFPEAMAVVDRLRAAGHAAVISGAGPSVLVLTTPQHAAGVAALAPAGWDALVPGVPRGGVAARRATLAMPLGEDLVAT